MDSKSHSCFEILIVDDNAANLKILSSILTEVDYNVKSATSVDQALRSIETKNPALILLDVRMPVMDGYQLCRILKANEKTSDIPVIFTSTAEEESSKVEGFRAGGVDFISKPFCKEEVLARVRTHIHLSAMQKQIVKQTDDLPRANDLLQAEIAFQKRNSALTSQLFVNKTICDLLGYTEAELKNKHWTEISHPNDEQLSKDVVSDLLAGKCNNYRFEKRDIHKNGGIVWTDVSTFLQRNEEGNPPYFITSVNTITHQKEVEADLREREYFF